VLAGAGRDVVAPFQDDSGAILENGNDQILGGPGDDRLNGGPGRDRVDGERGVDVCLSAEHARRCEKVTGGSGNTAVARPAHFRALLGGR
jgi:Ca2+-binding RTX toxin-like protein